MNRLKDLREDKDLYQKDIAKIFDMSQNGIIHLNIIDWLIKDEG